MRLFIQWLSLSIGGVLCGSQVLARSFTSDNQFSNLSASPQNGTDGQELATRCANLRQLVPAAIKKHKIEVYVSDLHSETISNDFFNFSASSPNTVPFREVIPNLPKFCRFGGYFNTSSTSRVQFEVWLPLEDWSGRFAFVGNGGNSGRVNYPDMAVPLTKYKFAVASTNTGHDGMEFDGTFAISNGETRHDFGYRAVHLSTIFSKSAVKHFYGKPANKNYWLGCSSGGKQGLKEVQAYPKDFDGVLAGAAAQWWTHLVNSCRNGWMVESNLRNSPMKEGFMNISDWALVHEHTLTQCDMLDGVKDGVIDNPLVCKPTFESLQCSQVNSHKSSSSETIPPKCLTSKQISVVRSAFEDWVDGDGTFLFPSYTHGSEFFARAGMFMPAVPFPVATDFFKYQVMNLTSVTRDNNFTSKGIIEMLSVADQTDPGKCNAIDGNILPFIQRGGKLMTYTGMSDPLIPSRSSIWYHGQVKKALGRDPRESYRLFPVPGMGHCGGGPGASSIGAAGQGVFPPTDMMQSSKFDSKHDMVLALIEWTENGKAPDHMIAAKFKNDQRAEGLQFQRKLCPWPLVSKYDGRGNPNSHHSFKCQEQ
ncbi:uncharacterized protein MELLADRAFT_91750 [Melampsora larici-populina 98AG31]|uniref:Carboxylic ester hydrolase n=1 Tax=Melampsora larici-populina (strain 98AG31 / pathotype 3-4-7) TaxID=747676 RepID=F4S063_MELLP|nr:uncharacterized protein MELLADRAFT_91750 [Melampsora larici-populina 98AG31]EGG01991.1 hypothetical protein MELLADRAFT_91750 [Melampsora larici-populina 98AG31]